MDWRAGELLVRGKGRLHDRLPITTEVGEALSRYLREERGATNRRHCTEAYGATAKIASALAWCYNHHSSV
jgi:hypothetical protein